MGEDFELLRILIFAAIAAFLVMRLRSVLGRRTGEERRRTPFSGPGSTTDHSTERETAEARHGDNVVAMPERGRREDIAGSTDLDHGEAAQSLSAGITQIRIADPGFDAGQFADGARRAFSFIVDAYAKGDTGTLRPLLSDDLYDEFSKAIRERLAAGETLETQIVDMRAADILEAKMDGRTAMVTMKFVTDQANIVRGHDGEAVDGGAEEPVEVIDIWTFARNTRSNDPNWMLVETRTPN